MIVTFILAKMHLWIHVALCVSSAYCPAQILDLTDQLDGKDSEYCGFENPKQENPSIIF